MLSKNSGSIFARNKHSALDRFAQRLTTISIFGDFHEYDDTASCRNPNNMESFTTTSTAMPTFLAERGDARKSQTRAIEIESLPTDA
jgi:hypothetical protein